MPDRWLIPQPIKDIPKKALSDAEDLLTQAKELLNLKRNKFVTVAGLTLLETDLKEEIERIKASVSESKTGKKDNMDYGSEEIKKTVDRLQKEKDLTQKEIKKLEKEVKNKEFMLLDINSQIERLESMANTLGKNREQLKTKKRFVKTYEKFFETLSEDLLDLDSKDKQDVKVMLEDLTDAIKTHIAKLE